MNTHTPGPWTISAGEILGGGEKLGVVYRTEGWSSGDPVENEDQANARLIDAAPDLLAALKETSVLAHAYGPEGPSSPDELATLARARAAIAKAEGTP